MGSGALETFAQEIAPLVMRTTLLSFAWVAVCAAFVGLFLGIDLDLNIFSWSGNWHLQSVACVTGILILIVATYFLAFATQKTLVSIVAAVSSVLLIGVGLYVVGPEPLGNPGQWLCRRAASPVWYRWGRLAIACIPLCILSCVFIRKKTCPCHSETHYDETQY